MLTIRLTTQNQYYGKAIGNSLETGILRLEFTMYLCKNTTRTLNRDVVYENMEYLENLLPPNYFFYFYREPI